MLVIKKLAAFVEEMFVSKINFQSNNYFSVSFSPDYLQLQCWLPLSTSMSGDNSASFSKFEGNTYYLMCKTMTVC